MRASDVPRACRLAPWLATVAILWPTLGHAQSVSVTLNPDPPLSAPVAVHDGDDPAWRFVVTANLANINGITGGELVLSANDDVLLLPPQLPAGWTSTAVTTATNPWRRKWVLTIPPSALTASFQVTALTRHGAFPNGATVSLSAELTALTTTTGPVSPLPAPAVFSIATSSDLDISVTSDLTDTYRIWGGLHPIGGVPTPGRFFTVRRSIRELGNGAFGIVPGDNQLTITLPAGAVFVGQPTNVVSGWSINAPVGNTFSATYTNPTGLRGALNAGSNAAPVSTVQDTERIEFTFFAPCAVLDTLGAWNDTGLAFTATHRGVDVPSQRTSNIVEPLIRDSGVGAGVGALACSDAYTSKTIEGVATRAPGAAVRYFVDVDPPAPTVVDEAVVWPEDVVIVDRIPDALEYVGVSVAPTGVAEIYLCDVAVAGTFNALEFTGFVTAGLCQPEASASITEPTHVVVYRAQWRDAADTTQHMRVTWDMQVRGDAGTTAATNWACVSGFNANTTLFGDPNGNPAAAPGCGRYVIDINSDQTPTVFVGLGLPAPTDTFTYPPLANQIIRSPGEALEVYVTFLRGAGTPLQNAYIDVTLPPGVIPTGATPFQVSPTGVGNPACANAGATFTALGNQRYRITPGVTSGVSCAQLHGGVPPVTTAHTIVYAFVIHTRLDPNTVFTSGPVDVLAEIKVVGPVRNPWAGNKDTAPLTIEVPFQLTLDASASDCKPGPVFDLGATVTNANDAAAGGVVLTFPAITNGGATAVYDLGSLVVPGVDPSDYTITPSPSVDPTSVAITFAALAPRQIVTATISYAFPGGPKITEAFAVEVVVSNASGQTSQLATYDLSDCPGAIEVRKFYDGNGNGINDGEALLDGWTFTVDGTAVVTTAGTATFSGLAPNTYSVVETVGTQSPGTTLFDPKGRIVGTQSILTGPSFAVPVYPGQTTVIEVGNACTCAPTCGGSTACGFEGTATICATVGVSCDDGQSCTNDACVDGHCVHTSTCQTSVDEQACLQWACVADTCVEVEWVPPVCADRGTIVHGVVETAAGLRGFRCEVRPAPGGGVTPVCDTDLQGNLALNAPQCGE